MVLLGAADIKVLGIENYRVWKTVNRSVFSFFLFFSVENYEIMIANFSGE